MKKIILCLDGTWNDDTSPTRLTNVAKLHGLVAPVDAKGVRQVSHYVAGIASTKGEWAQFLKGALGVGVTGRIEKAYAVLAESYEPGDEIHIFGFSRGAYEARRLAGLIALLGVPRQGMPGDFEKAWALYRKREPKRDEKRLAELRAERHFPVRIKCVGVWDTVGNLGNPFFSSGPIGRKFKFHDTHPVNAMDVGLHALSIDEVRGPFRPTLWTLPEGKTLPPHQHVEQVWFAGSHADVGGGYRECGLSDVGLRWMAERATATTGLAFDREKLSKTTRPDPLGPQHSSTGGFLYFWSGLFPFIRLIKQDVRAIPEWRRNIFGTWRTGKLPKGEASINESVPEGVVERLGQRVVELQGTRARCITYRPASLAPGMTQPTPKSTPAKAERRVKIFTVHGTFAHETDWDNWDEKDAGKKNEADRAFINRLGAKLAERGVTLGIGDHSQYNWSGGNSHDERRTGAIGLKKHIDGELLEAERQHGKDYYDGVYVIGHSHGGTIARIAMNLWDKGHDYYDPITHKTFEEEFKHDNKCQACMQPRHGEVGPATAKRPDGVITFGSPFVNFEERPGGLLAARLGVWVFRALAFVVLTAVLAATYVFEANPVEVVAAFVPGWLETLLLFLWPLALYWFLAFYLPRATLPYFERWSGKSGGFIAATAAFQIVKAVLLVALAVYYAAYFIGVYNGTGGWNNAARWLPFLGNATLHLWLAWFALIALWWLVVVSLPSRYLSWLRRKVAGLREHLPKKYDPREDRPVSYLSYHTLGDEAGVHLRVFGLLTWLVQTLALAAAFMLAVGLLLLPIIAIDALTGGSLLSMFGISAFGDNLEHRDRFIALIDWLTYLPRTWPALLGWSEGQALGQLENARDVAWYIPWALSITLLLVFVLLMPVLLIVIGIVYLVSALLRRSGYVFGSESMAWTLANRIAVTRLPNDSTQFRFLFISPEAWRRGEIAHCYYYKSGRVIEDVANHIADWSSHAPTRVLPVERWVASGARWMVVAAFVGAIFAASVPIAALMASSAPQLAGLASGGGMAGSGPEPETSASRGGEASTTPAFFEGDTRFCASEPHTVTLTEGVRDSSAIEQARKQWLAEVSAKYGPEFANWDSKGSGGSECGDNPLSLEQPSCMVSYQPCKWKPIECKAAPHSVEIAFEAALGPDLDTDFQDSIKSSLAYRAERKWYSEVRAKFGADWIDPDFNLKSRFDVDMGDYRAAHKLPVEQGCTDRASEGGRIRFQCKVSAVPCKKPPTQ